MDTISAGILRQLSILSHKCGIQIQKHYLLLLGRLLHKIIISPQMFVGQITGTPGGRNHILIQRNQPLDINDRVGLTGADGIDGLAVSLVEALVIVVAQLIDPQGQIDLPILFQRKGLQKRVFLPVNGKGLLLCQLENRQAIGR